MGPSIPAARRRTGAHPETPFRGLISMLNTQYPAFHGHLTMRSVAGRSTQDDTSRLGVREVTLLRARTVHNSDLRAGLARCLSAAFSSGIWRSTPMPLGHSRDPHSAFGVIEGLSDRPVVLAAVSDDREDTHCGIVGCVLGAVLDYGIIADYGLAPFGACPGDGLLAFIGLVPEMQGRRVRRLDHDALEITGESEQESCGSLASQLFEEWMRTAPVSKCPRIFIRTRRQIGPILHLSRTCGFAYRGAFQTEFRGEVQDRLVFMRTNPMSGDRRGAPRRDPL